VLLTASVKEYRATVADHVLFTDRVLEVGCATGSTTKVLAAQAHYVLAIDQSERVHEAERHGIANADFRRWNAWDIAQIRRVSAQFDKIYVDISGSGPPEIVMRLVRGYEAAFRPSMIVVKNTRLKAFIARSQVWKPQVEHDGNEAALVACEQPDTYG
jgi:SAM-dependent methyltransferase